MRFRFRLQKVLEFTEMRERAKKNEISSCVRRIQFLDDRKQKLQDNIRGLLDRDARELRPEWVPYSEAKIATDAAEIKLIEKEIIVEHEKLAQKKEELGHIMARKKGLDSLKEKRWRDFRISEDRLLQKRLDEQHRLLKIARD